MALKANCIRLREKRRSRLTKTLLIMKFLATFLLISTFGVSARDFAQGITISQKNVPIQTVFKEIEHQTNYRFFYNESLLTETVKVSVDVKNVSLLEALDACFKESPSLTYSVIEKTIVVKAKKKELQILQVPNAGDDPKTMDVKGKVTDEAGAPVEGVTVAAKSIATATATGKTSTSNKLAITNNQGEFELSSVEVNSVLHFSSIGYEPQTMPVVNGATFVVKLKVAVKGLDQAVVIAYGQTSQRLATGSVSKVTSEEIEQQPISNPLAALEGRVPGLLVTTTSGLPGASFKIQIRGQNSIASKPSSAILPLDNPYFIIDGVPFAPQNGNINQFGSLASPGGGVFYGNPYGGISPFNTINPADIESIEILRDADATAIYGSKGANGVVLITTKKGKVGKTTFNTNIRTGQSQATHFMPLMNTQEYLQMRREALKNDNAVPTISTAQDLLLFDTTSYTNWNNYFIGGTAKTIDANSFLSGGDANTQFLIGAGYYHETYIYPGPFAYNKASINASLHHNSSNQKLLFDFSANYSYDKNNSSGQPSLLPSIFQAPDYPSLTNSDGSLNWNYKGFSLANPLAYLKQRYTTNNYNLLGHLGIAYRILPELTLKSSFGYNSFNGGENSIIPNSSQNPASNPTSYSTFATNQFESWIIEPQVEFKKNLGKGNLNILIGSTFQQSTNKSTFIQGGNYTSDVLLGSISAAGFIAQAGDNFSLYKYSAIFGRINYIWANKFLFDLNGRRDGSTRFGPGKQFGDFGSVGGGWIFSEESFIKSLQGLSFGKIRISYGTTGNDAIGNYQYQENWLPTSQAYQNLRGYVPQNLFNPDFSWSVNKKFETALELGFLKDRIFLNTTWYQNRCGNELISYTLPSQTGFTSVIQNFDAIIQNQGFEFQVVTKNIVKKGFSWTTSFNLTIPQNRLLSFPNIATSPYASKLVVGKSLSVLNKVKYAGVNDTTGVFQFVGANGKLTYTPKTSAAILGGDFQAIGDLDPKYYGGLRNTITFKGLQLDMFVEFRKQIGPNYLQQIYNYTAVGFFGRNMPEAFLARWQKVGDKTEIERFTSKNSGTQASNVKNAFVNSSGAYSDASFIRLKTVSISYSVPNKYLKKIRSQGCNLYLAAQNLLTITNYLGNDPENMSFFSLPPMKTIVAGLQFSF